ncbi:MAG TPA: hypothetical protein VKP30_16410 [Polyangiaceae bacterium]|nr:hypothetical protein [Polyangiaceae bacterium]
MIQGVRHAAVQLGFTLGLVLGLFVAATAHADQASVDRSGLGTTVDADVHSPVLPPTQEAPSRERATLLLTVHSDTPDVTPEMIRAALAQETGLEVQLRTTDVADPNATLIVIAYRLRTRELAVSLSQPGRANTTRIVEAPKTSEEVVNVAALLATSLARSATEQRDQQQFAPVQSVPPEVLPNVPVTVPAPATVSGPDREMPARVETFATASLIYPIATNYATPDAYTHLSFNLVYGHIGGIDGLELGLVNTVSGTERGLQAAGLVNWVLGDFTGIELAGVINSARSLNGLQVALGGNYVQQRRMGGQVSAFANLAGGNAIGVALTLGLNSARSGEGLGT